VFKKVIKIEILTKAIDKFDNEIESYKNKLEEINAQVLKHNSQIKSKNEEIEKLVEYKNKLMEQIDDLNSGVKLKNILAEIDELNLKISENTEAIKTLKLAYEEKKKRFKFNKFSNEHYNELLKNMNEEFDQKKEV